MLLLLLVLFVVVCVVVAVEVVVVEVTVIQKNLCFECNCCAMIEELLVVVVCFY